MTTPPRLYLLDAFGLIYRSYFALARQNLTTAAGEPTGAVYGVTAYLLKLLREEKPEALAVVFDTPEPTFRHERHPGYKASRPPPPDDLIAQLPPIREVIAAMGLCTLELPGYEADDVMATAARWAAERGWRARLVTGDKDMLQLVGGPVEVEIPGRGGEPGTVLDPAGVEAKWGVRPDQIPAFLAVVGDSVDDIPGVPRIGPKGAAALLQRFGTLDDLYARLDEVPSEKTREALREHEARVRENMHLVRVVTDAPVALDAARLEVKPLDPAKLAPLFERLSFRRWAAAMREELGEGRAEAGALPAPAPASPGEVPPPAGAAFWEEALAAPAVALALEGDRIALALGSGEAATAALPAASAGDSAERARLFALLGEERVAKVSPHLKRIVHALEAWDAPARGAFFDTTLAARLRDAGGSGETDDPGEAGPDAEAGPGDGAPVALALDFGPGPGGSPAPEAAAREAARRALAEAPALGEELRAAGLARVYGELEIPLLFALARMERAGIAVDVAELARLSDEMMRRLGGIEREIHELAGGAFNIHSTRQLKEVLFGRLGLKPGRRTKTGFSTDAGVLSDLAAEHPLPGLILRYRHLAKLRSTYAEGLRPLIRPETGRIHTTFDQAGAATGRISSRDPNLQNIPIRTEEGRAIRRVFTAGGEGRHLIVADYSQIELRLLAHLAPDEGLREAFAAGTDFHTATAAAVFGVPLAEATPDMRSRAKAVNYGILYGMGARSLARSMEVPEKEAKAFIAGYFERFPGVKAFIEATLAEASARGFVTTMSGRRRRLPELASSRREVRAFGERAAVNSRIQGSAADIMKGAIVAVDRELARRGWPARLLLTVHDELVLEAPDGEGLTELVELVSGLMRAPTPEAEALRVPLEVAVGHAPNWVDAHA